MEQHLLNENREIFYSKVLLFGEYSLIRKSMALALPFNLFEGSLRFPRDGKPGNDTELKSLVSYLKKRDVDSNLFPIDLGSFEFDVSQGLYFDSTIPQGFGVGSSGALCAAVYQRYALDECVDIKKLKNRFSLIENHFHGSSSGFDPLVSYLNKSILINEDQSLVVLDQSLHSNSGQGGIFLLNTGRSRKTEPLVNLFLEKCKFHEFAKLCDGELAPITNQCIHSLLEKDFDQLASSMRRLSMIQFEHFKPMIPTLFHDVWAYGLESNSFQLKLCGAGGGGFLLGITHNLSNIAKVLKDYETRVVLRF